MSQYTNSQTGMNDPDIANKMPNTYGKVRTFKEDLDNFEKRGTVANAPGPENLPLPPLVNPSENKFQPQPERPQAIPVVPAAENPPENIFQPTPTPPPLTPQSPGLPEFKSAPSQSFFSENTPPAEEAVQTAQPAAQSAPKKSGRKLLIPVIIIVIILLGGAGFSYYWFFMKGSAPAPVTTPAQSTPAPAATTQTATAQNKNMRQLVVDTTQGNTEIKNALEKFAASFGASAAESDLAEIKILNTSNQPVTKKDLISGFGITVPDAVSGKLSEDFSLFAIKEQGAVKLGIVFKTITSAGLSEAMQAWEPTIATDLGSLYSGQTLSPTTGTFNSAKYKNADIRYLNFSSPAGASLDYSVISNFLIIGTSKDSSRAIMDYMSEK